MTDFTETRLCVYEERYSCANILVPVGTELVEINDSALAEAMKRLPPRQRDLIYKSFFLEMKDEEIAVSQHRKVQSLKALSPGISKTTRFSQFCSRLCATQGRTIILSQRCALMLTSSLLHMLIQTP